MKNSRVGGEQTALAVQQEISGMPNAEVIYTIGMPEKTLYRRTKKSNIMGSCEDCRFKKLAEENRRLENLVEDLKLDKFSQAQRMNELNREKSVLKKALAELMLDNQNLKEALKEVEEKAIRIY